MSRTARIALAALSALAATSVEAQWRTEPITVWLDAPASAVLGNYSSATAGTDLLLIDQAARAEVRPFHALLTREPSTFAFPWLGQSRVFRGGRLAQNGADALPDVARIGGEGFVEVAFGDAPGTVRAYPATHPVIDEAAAFLHLLPRAADVLVVPNFPGAQGITGRGIAVLDFNPAGVPTERRLPIAPVYLNYLTTPRGFEAVPLRVSGVARANGLDDVALLETGGVVLLVHDAVPVTTTLAGLRLSAPIEVGGNGGGAWPFPWTGTRRPPWLPRPCRARARRSGSR